MFFLVSMIFEGTGQDLYTLSNKEIEISIDQRGNLVSLKNLQTGHNYASGRTLWRLYFDTHKEKGIQITGMDNQPGIRKEGAEIIIDYVSLKTANSSVNMKLSLKITLKEKQVRFSSEISNNEPKTIVREIQYPLVGNCQLPEDHQLLTTHLGGQLFPDPKMKIMSVGNNPPYMAPSQHFRQMDLKYPAHTASNCFAFTGKKQGLYFGSHDSTFQDTWHGLRVYPDDNRVFNVLEAGLYKYPECMNGHTWKCNANVIVPYSGDWHQTSKIYRKWADTWWSHQKPPVWIREMTGWQRIIFRHQYGETFFRYTDLDKRILKAGEDAGTNAVLAFAWWDSGMDNGYPDSYFVTDADQGGDQGWKEAISNFKNKGGKLLLYFNGKLIDTESDYYKKGNGKAVCYKTNMGTEYTEAYRFKAHDTFTGNFNARSFVVADTRNPEWRQKLLDMADRANFFGADAVFYDQLGYCESVSNWDLTGEFPVAHHRVIADKAAALQLVREYLRTKNYNLALGTELFSDVTAQHVDFVHNLYGATGPFDFTDWVRYTFPEVVLSDREIRDDTNIEWRVNHTLLKGLRNDIEIYRCRGLIDETPHYQQYLAKINNLKKKYRDLLLLGTYRDMEGFSSDDKTAIKARSFVNGNRMAIVATHNQELTASTKITVPGHRFKESSGIGDVKISTVAGNVQEITIGKDGLVVLIYERE